MRYSTPSELGLFPAVEEKSSLPYRVYQMSHCEAHADIGGLRPGATSSLFLFRALCARTGAFPFSGCLFQPLLKGRSIPTSYSTRKNLFLSLRWWSCCVLPHQVNSVCWASLNHLDSHILYPLADEEVWWAGHALLWTGIYGVCEVVS